MRNDHLLSILPEKAATRIPAPTERVDSVAMPAHARPQFESAGLLGAATNCCRVGAES